MGGARESSSSPQHRPGSSSGGARRLSADESQPLIGQEAIERIPSNISTYYEITEITEMGRMASLFFSRGGRNMFYICLVIYLYGDLAIYGAAVAKSVRDVACSYKPSNMTSSLNISDSEVINHYYHTTTDQHHLVLSHAGPGPAKQGWTPTESSSRCSSAPSGSLYSAM